jgi:hypothetical protein
MVQQVINASVGQFEALISSPKAWQVVGLKSWGLVRNDEVKYIEVDTFAVPTGRMRIGVVFYVGSGDLLINNGLSCIYYCQDIQTIIGEAIVGRDLIIG